MKKFWIVSIAFFAASTLLYAGFAGVRLVGPERVGKGEEFTVGVSISTTQPLNAYAVELNYPSDVLEILAFDDSRSVIDVWQEQPIVFQSGRVVFGGGSLRAFRGEEGELLRVRFRALREGAAELRFGKTSFYLANGKGTKTVPDLGNLVVAVVPEPVLAAADRDDASFFGDTAPPEIPHLSIVDDPFNPDQKLLAFSARDAGSGIQKVLVRSRSWFFWSEWKPATNPVSLRKSVWAVNFKAIDNGGNAAERVLYDWKAFLGHRGSLLLGAALFLAIGLLMRKTRTKRL